MSFILNVPVLRACKNCSHVEHIFKTPNSRKVTARTPAVCHHTNGISRAPTYCRLLGRRATTQEAQAEAERLNGTPKE